MEALKASRPRVGQLPPEGFLNETAIAVEGRIAGTLGECKEGLDISDKGVWGGITRPSAARPIRRKGAPGGTARAMSPAIKAPSSGARGRSLWSAPTRTASLSGATPTFPARASSMKGMIQR